MDPLLRETVGLQLSILESSDLILVLLGVSVQRAEIQIARGLRVVEVVMVGLK